MRRRVGACKLRLPPPPGAGPAMTEGTRWTLWSDDDVGGTWGSMGESSGCHHRLLWLLLPNIQRGPVDGVSRRRRRSIRPSCRLLRAINSLVHSPSVLLLLHTHTTLSVYVCINIGKRAGGGVGSGRRVKKGDPARRKL